MTVPASVAVDASSLGGTVTLAGTATADLDSRGGPVNASSVASATTRVTTDSGGLRTTPPGGGT